MSTVPQIPFESHTAARLRAERRALSRAWEQRIASHGRTPWGDAVPLSEWEATLDALLDYVAVFVDPQAGDMLSTYSRAVQRLSTIAQLWYERGLDPQELVRDLDLLAELLDEACTAWLNSYPGQPSGEEIVRTAGRANRATLRLAEVLVGAYRAEVGRESNGSANETRDFAEMLAHELNSPLNAAEVAALMLEEEGLVVTREERRRFVALILRGLRRARTVVSDVRALVAASAGGGSTRRMPLRLVLADVLAALDEVARQAGVRVEIAEPVPELVVEASYAEAALLNLISNSIKYSDPERTRRWVRICFERADAAEDEWWVQIRDNGLGIPPEHHHRVFERFFRAHPERSEGTGLGLTIVREALRRLGSELHFTSEPGVGTTLRFMLRSKPG